VRALPIKAAVIVALCGTAASCAAPASRPARHAAAKAAEAMSASGTGALAIPKPVTAAPPAFGAQPGTILGVYNGGVPTTYSLVNRFASEVGRQPNVVMYFSAWGDSFRTSFASVALRHGAVPFVELEPYTVSMQSIAAGQQDAYLRSYADAVRTFGHRVLIGFAHEMNGSWYPWGYTPPGGMSSRSSAAPGLST
jgi:mannan endo-1,4-beta-mannosidase